MCGISAIISFEDSDTVSNIFRMTQIIRHRGPDDEGYAVFGNNPSDIRAYGGDDTPERVYGCGLDYAPIQKHPPEIHGRLALGHRRLSIIDLSAKGHQPMSYKNRRYWISYNGEIYNYIEIRAELVQKGHSFASGTDTEVILAAYDEWGEDCLNRFNGMWAFVIYDTIRNKVFAARDRFGVKPLFYWRIPGTKFLAIGSEIKQFTIFDRWKPQINEKSVYSFLKYGIRNYSKDTFFRDVDELRGGQKIIFDLNTNAMDIQSWYDLGDRIAESTDDFNASQDTFRRLLTESISLRFRSDVKVGSCLSGGLDSSSIVCLANEILKGKSLKGIHETVSSCAHDSKYDEQRFIDEVISATGQKSHKIFPSDEELLRILGKLMWVHDEPIPNTSMYSQWKVFEGAKRNNIKVMLDGQGGDELLAGYHLYYECFFWDLLMKMKYHDLVHEIYQYGKIHSYGFIDSFKFIGRHVLNEKYIKYLKIISNRNNYEWLTWKGDKDDIEYYENNIRNMSLSHIRSTNLPMLLHYEDRNSMAHSVESRVPFLDYRLVEYVLSLPDNYKMRHGQTKYILRKSMAGIVPDIILNRHDKMGFSTPEPSWIMNNSKAFRKELAMSTEIFAKYLDPEFVLKTYDSDIHDKRIISSSAYWRIVAAGNWARIFRIEI